MSRLLFIWGLIGFSFLQLSCFDFGDCFLQSPDETAQTEILEIIASSDFSTFRILRKTTLDRGDSFTPFDGDLHSFQFSLNGNFATFFSYENPSGNKVINYGPSIASLQDKLGPYSTVRGVLSPTDDVAGVVDFSSLTYTLSHLNNSEAYIINFTILFENIRNPEIDTLQVGHKPTFTDSMSMKSIFLDNVQFDKSGNVLALSATLESDIEWTKILWGEAYYGIPKRIINPSLISINSLNEIDTLYSLREFPDSLSNQYFNFNSLYDFSYKSTENYIFISMGESVHILNKQSRRLTEPIYTGELPLHLSPNSKYALTRNQLINLQTREVKQLSENFAGYQQGYLSNSNIVFVNNDGDGISIFDIESFELEKEISLAQVPDFQELEQIDYSKVYLTEPIFNNNDELVFMLVRHSRLLDPNYDCYD